jgi:hypothetical protein
MLDRPGQVNALASREESRVIQVTTGIAPGLTELIPS